MGFLELCLLALFGAPRFSVLLAIGLGYTACPGVADVAQQNGIDDESTEGIDESHVPRGYAADRSNLDGPIEAITRRMLHQRENREGVNRVVLNL